MCLAPRSRGPWTRFYVSITFFIVLSVYSGSGQAFGQAVDVPARLSSPALSIDIRQFGFVPISDEDFQNFNGYVMRDPHVKVVFLSDSTVAVYWTRGPNAEVGAKEHLIMRALFFDTSTGKLQHSESWPVKKRDDAFESLDTEARIFPSKGGKFLVQANSKLTLFSEDFAQLKQITLGSSDGRFGLAVAPGGGRILVSKIEWRERTFSWLDAENLDVLPDEPAPELDPDKGLAPGTEVLPGSSGYLFSVGTEIRWTIGKKTSALRCDIPGCDVGFLITPLATGKVAIVTTRAFALYGLDGNQSLKKGMKSNA